MPYVALGHRGEPDHARGAERLAEVAKEARALMDAHGLEEWTLRFGAAQRSLGACLEQLKIVEIARWHAARSEPRQVLSCKGSSFASQTIENDNTGA